MDKKLIYCLISILTITIFTACTPAQRPLDNTDLRDNGIVNDNDGDINDNIFDNNNGYNNQNNMNRMNRTPDNNGYMDR
ncbi:MAG: hypothetical protein GX285_01810 [Clostridiales bacterium]|nr:hypothetical protein [Clostridiales bacterium]